MGAHSADHGVVLVAEDDPMTARLISGWVARAGADVVWATSCADALELARRRDPDLAIVDTSLSGGRHLADSLRGRRPLRRVPVMTVSPNAGRKFSAEIFQEQLGAALRAA